MIIIALYGLFALSIGGILTDAAREAGAQNLIPSRRSGPSESKVNIIRFLGDPLSHKLFVNLEKQDGYAMLEDGSMILRGVLYDEYCLPPPSYRAVGRLYPRFQDCKAYLRQTSPNQFSEEKCPRNSLFDPSTLSCVVFNNLRLLPDNCIMKCPSAEEDPIDPEVLVKKEFNIYCEALKDDGTSITTTECSHMFAKPSSPKKSEMLNSLPTDALKEGSAKSDSDGDGNHFSGEQGEDRPVSTTMATITKILTNQKVLEKNSLEKSAPKMKPTVNAVPKKPGTLQDFIYGSGEEMSDDGVKYSIREEYSDFSGAVYDFNRSYY